MRKHNPRRYFLAVDPDAAARSGIAVVVGETERALADAATALRWTSVANVHLTLHFLGDVDDTRLPDLRSRLGEPIHVAPFDIALAELGTFPPGGAPRILWIAVGEGRHELEIVHRELGRRLEAAGVVLEDRPFAPHLTLARVRERERRRARLLAAGLAQVRVPAVGWRVNHVTLYLSDLSGSAPRYDAIQHVSLGQLSSRSLGTGD